MTVPGSPQRNVKAATLLANFAWGSDDKVMLIPSKTRKLGWTGYYDTWEDMSNNFDTLKEKVVPD